MAGRRAAALGVVGVIVTGGAALAAVGLGGGSEEPAAEAAPAPPATAPVRRTTLVETQTVDGVLRYGGARTVGGAGTGVITALPGLGSVLSRGEAVYRADDEPVPLLYGELPMYRALSPGKEGRDVRQLERNLRALGYTGFTVDDAYSRATAAAVKRWQDDLGVTETGEVAPGAVVVAPGRIRVAGHEKRVGDPAGGAVLACTGTNRVVAVDLDVRHRSLVREGAAVQVELPSGETVDGEIASVGKVAREGEDGGPATVGVTVSVGDRKATAPYDKAPVTVRLVAERHEDVLAVPVGALLAQGDGGYAVQVVENGAVRTVPVRTGVFTGGMVEVSGRGLAAGTKVGVPS